MISWISWSWAGGLVYLTFSVSLATGYISVSSYISVLYIISVFPSSLHKNTLVVWCVLFMCIVVVVAATHRREVTLQPAPATLCPLLAGSPARVDPNTANDLTDAEQAIKEAEAVNANKALRIAIDATILVKQIQVEACYPQILEEVVLAGSVGHPILMDMLTEATGGTKPG